jgi:hypothetical protein
LPRCLVAVGSGVVALAGLLTAGTLRAGSVAEQLPSDAAWHSPGSHRSRAATPHAGPMPLQVAVLVPVALAANATAPVTIAAPPPAPAGAGDTNPNGNEVPSSETSASEMSAAAPAAPLSSDEWASSTSDDQGAAATATAGEGSADGDLVALRACESGGDYGAVSAGGSFRGAYQFNRMTWDAVASRWNAGLVGVDPAAASPTDQDAMARALQAEAGSTPWPHCGAYL